jgi:hypothetical protein
MTMRIRLGSSLLSVVPRPRLVEEGQGGIDLLQQALKLFAILRTGIFLEALEHLLLLCKEPCKGSSHPERLISRLIQQKAARSMPSGPPGSKFMRDEKPL